MGLRGFPAVNAGSTERAGRVLARHVDVVVLEVVRVREEHGVGGAVEEEAQALGQVAQVGGLAVEEEEEEEALELRVAHPLVPLIGRDMGDAG